MTRPFPPDWSTVAPGTEFVTRCVSCGRFMNPSAPGASGWQTWGYCMDGSPDLHDPVHQCPPCTDKHGHQHSNCHPPEAYQWRNPAESPQ